MKPEPAAWRKPPKLKMFFSPKDRSLQNNIERKNLRKNKIIILGEKFIIFQQISRKKIILNFDRSRTSAYTKNNIRKFLSLEDK